MMLIVDRTLYLLSQTLSEIYFKYFSHYSDNNMALISKNTNDRVMIFIDIMNITKAVEGKTELRLDPYALALNLIGPRQMVAGYIFDSRSEDITNNERYLNQKKFHDKLRYMGFRVIARESFDPQRPEQKEVDVAMACEMVVHAMKNNYDVAIVVSGDRDFIPAIQHVQAAGKRVEVAAFRDTIGNREAIRRFADEYYELGEMPVLEMRSPPGAEIGDDGKGME